MIIPLDQPLIDDQIEEIEFVGKTKDSALRLAQRQGFIGDPDRYGWVAPGIWLLRYRAPTAHPTRCP